MDGVDERLYAAAVLYTVDIWTAPACRRQSIYLLYKLQLTSGLGLTTS